MSSRTIEIIDPEGERRDSRRNKILVLAVLASLSLFGYPEAKDYYTKWRALRTGRILATTLSTLKTRSILEKRPFEARFRVPDLVEIYQVSSCGPIAERVKISEVRLSEFDTEVEFAPEPWVRQSNGSREPFLPRFCYDPLYGSSVLADGLAHGSIFLAHRADLINKRGEHLVQLLVEGAAGDINLE